MYYGSGTGGRSCICAGLTLRVHSPGGSAFLCEITSWPSSWTCDVMSKIGPRQSMRIYLKNEFRPDPIWNVYDRSLGFFEEVAPTRRTTRWIAITRWAPDPITAKRRQRNRCSSRSAAKLITECNKFIYRIPHEMNKIHLPSGQHESALLDNYTDSKHTRLFSIVGLIVIIIVAINSQAYQYNEVILLCLTLWYHGNVNNSGSWRTIT